jgi:hypothetical protein
LRRKERMEQQKDNEYRKKKRKAEKEYLFYK